MLDLGAGTATLTMMVKHAHPGADAVGLDGDAHLLQIARAKASLITRFKGLPND